MVVAATLGWIGPVPTLGWQRPPPLPAAPIKGADPRWDTHTHNQAHVPMAQPRPTALLALRGKTRRRRQPPLPSCHG